MVTPKCLILICIILYVSRSPMFMYVFSLLLFGIKLEPAACVSSPSKATVALALEPHGSPQVPWPLGPGPSRTPSCPSRCLCGIGALVHRLIHPMCFFPYSNSAMFYLHLCTCFWLTQLKQTRVQVTNFKTFCFLIAVEAQNHFVVCRHILPPDF